MASCSLLLLFLALSFWSAHSHSSQLFPSSIFGSSHLLQAVAVLNGNGIHGTVYFNQGAHHGSTAVTGYISGLKPGLHGFHVHVSGNLTNGCTSAGPHYNPFNKEHGAPQDTNRHAGDLGNVVAGADGTAIIFIVDRQIPLKGEYSIVGRAVVVHANQDDLGRGGQPESKTTGNSGARLACGVISLQG